MSELLADEFAVNVSSVPMERTQTPEEALELSIWSPHNTFNISILRLVIKEKNRGEREFPIPTMINET